MEGKNPRTQPGKFAGISAEDWKWKTELPEEKYTRNAGGDNQKGCPFFIRFRSLSLAARRHNSRVRADSSGW